MKHKFKVRIANTDEKRREGLYGVTELNDNEGMLFEFDEPGLYTITTKGMLIPIDIIFLNDKDTVLEVYEGIPDHKDVTGTKSATKILEAPHKSQVQIGDTIEFDNSIGKDMEVLDEDGEVQMKTEGAERIFSREHTKKLIKLIKLSKNAESDEDFVELAIMLTAILKIQDNQEQQFVEV